MSELPTRKGSDPGVRIARLRAPAGPARLAPVGEHRIVVHDSAATWSTCMTTGARHLRRRGDIDIVPAGEEGGFGAAAAFESLEIRLPPRMVESSLARPAPPRLQHMLRNERIVHLARALDIERTMGRPSDPLYTDAIGYALATQLGGVAERPPSPRNRLSPRQLRRAFDFVEAHIDTPLSVAVLAREAGASSSHFRHWFKEATGLTVHRYVVARRVERARALLLEGRLNATEVALAVGFAHQSHLARWMRRELGITPRGLAKTGAALQGPA